VTLIRRLDNSWMILYLLNNNWLVRHPPFCGGWCLWPRLCRLPL